MLTAMLIMTLGFWLYSTAVTLGRMRCVILERERRSAWGVHQAHRDVLEVH